MENVFSKQKQRQDTCVQLKNLSGPSCRGSLVEKRKRSVRLYTDQALLDQHTGPPSKTDLPDQSAHTIVTELLNLIKQQATPGIEIDVFSGDPLEYTYFMTS